MRLSDLSAVHTSEEAARRTLARRRSESRLRLYGILAIMLAGLSLAMLLGTIAVKTVGALTESYITLPARLDAAEIDPSGSRNPEEILKANFGGVAKAALRETFPSVRSRAGKRQLYDIVSSGAEFELGEHVAQNPGLVGTVVEYRFLASDIADLYLQGGYGSLGEFRPGGPVTVMASGEGEAEIAASGGGFLELLRDLKSGLSGDVARLRRNAALHGNGAAEFARRAGESSDEAARAESLRLAEERAAERDRLEAQAQALESRAGDLGRPEALGESTLSVFAHRGGTWLKLTELGADFARASVLAGGAELSGEVGRAGAEAGQADGGGWRILVNDVPEGARKISDSQIAWLESLRGQGRIDRVFNARFFTSSDSREPELAGLWGAVVGTFWTMLVTFALAFPTGVLAAIYLEEFAPKNRVTDLIEVNINNLAAVPSIIFGLLGLSVFLGVFGVPRSAPLAGGIVLALMTLPTIIIASRASLKAVPPSIREAALGVGASEVQTAFHHVLPLSLPGILTGTIIGMAGALGETAPLIMIGMVAFIVEVPSGILDSASVLPVQVFRWSDLPERAFEARTAAAICALLVFLIAMNALAVYLRRQFERRW